MHVRAGGQADIYYGKCLLVWDVRIRVCSVGGGLQCKPLMLFVHVYMRAKMSGHGKPGQVLRVCCYKYGAVVCKDSDFQDCVRFLGY